MLYAEDLIDYVIDGNLGVVRRQLEAAPPMVAATVAVDLFRFIHYSGTPASPSSGEFIRNLRSWQR